MGDGQGAGRGKLWCILAQAHPTTAAAATIDSKGGSGVAVGEIFCLTAAAAETVLVVGGGGTTGKGSSIGLEGGGYRNGERFRPLVTITTAAVAAATEGGG